MKTDPKYDGLVMSQHFTTIVKSMGPQLSSAVKDFARETEFQSLWEVLVYTFYKQSGEGLKISP